MRYGATANGRAKSLRNNHGYSKEDSAVLGEQLVDPYTRCAICGVPGRWIEVYRQMGWKSGPFYRRLTVDHIDPAGPSTLDNSRILCCMCNSTRGHNRYTDEETLYRTSRWYENRGFSSKELWWLHHSPGRGGKERLGTLVHEIPNRS